MAIEQRNILFAGGGTGGHLYPGLAIADEIKKRSPGVGIFFVGTKNKIEAQVVPKRGYDFTPIWVSGFKRSLSLGNLLFPIKVFVALMQSFFLIRRLKPAVVVGTGGYVCGPPLYMATLLGIPTLIQEQNSYPGITTRRLAGRVDEVHISFEASKRHLAGIKNVRLTGNPTRSSLRDVSRNEAAAYFGLEAKTRTLLVFGGSLGATSINNEVQRCFPDLLDLGLQIIWQTGQADVERIQAAVKENLNTETEKRVHVVAFIERMEFAYGASDLAVCRAGASTLAELAVVGLPSILVPYPFAAADHQTENAKAMVTNNAAMIVQDRDLEKDLFRTIQQLINRNDQLMTMSANARLLAKPDAARILAESVLSLAKA